MKRQWTVGKTPSKSADSSFVRGKPTECSCAATKDVVGTQYNGVQECPERERSRKHSHLQDRREQCTVVCVCVCVCAPPNTFSGHRERDGTA